MKCWICHKPHHTSLDTPESLAKFGREILDAQCHVLFAAFGPIKDRFPDAKSPEFLAAYEELAEAMGHLGGCCEATGKRKGKEELVDQLVYDGPGTYVIEVTDAKAPLAARRLN